MKKHEAFPGRFFKADDLMNGPITRTIKHVKSEQVGDDRRMVVYFEDDDKGLVLNKTNFDAIEEFSGKDDTDNWDGITLKLGMVKVPYQGKRVPAVRVLGVTAASDMDDDNTPPDDSIPF